MRDKTENTDRPPDRLGRFQSNVVDRNLGFAYLSIPKAANSAIKLALAETRGLKDGDFVNGTPVRKLLHKQAGGIFAFERLDQIRKDRPEFVFTAVRNTWDRVASCYRNKIVGSFHQPFASYGFTNDMSFVDFLAEIRSIGDDTAEIHFRSQLSLLFDKGQFLPDLVLHSERLSQTWPIVQSYFKERHKLTIPSLRSINVSPITTKLYDSRCVDLVRERYGEEIAFFGFEPPRL